MRNTKQRTYFSREGFIYIILIALAIVIAGKLFILQVVQASELKTKGIERRTKDSSIQPERGTIFDSQGNVLAQSIPVKEVYADPRTLDQTITQGQIKQSKDDIARKLASILGEDQKDILEKLNKDLAWISLAHQVDLAKVEEIAALKIPGIGFNDEQKRVYPMDKLASSVLGIVNLSGHGVEGVEGYYDKELYGNPGYTSINTNLKSAAAINTPSWQGANLTLTLDSTIQYLVENQLDDLQKATNAKRVAILAMDPMSGRILGMGSRPSYNPNEYDKANAEERRNLNISMSYEPGSTFKIITGSAALEEGVISPNDYFNDPGYLRVGPRLISNWDSDQKAHGMLTFTQGMELSSNVVLAQVGMKLGKDSFYTYLKAFGFGAKTGIDIAGEEGGLLIPQDKAREIDLATMSFGQANLVTPVQMLTAISAVANGGKLYKPYIVDKLTYSDGSIKQNQPTVVRQVISKTTADQITNVLEQVVSQGTGGLAQIPGIRVAGKTGTAQKVDPTTGSYSTTDFIASFAAFAPADNPKIAVLVVIDTPHGESHQGGTLGAPRAKAIIEGALQYYGIPFDKETKSTVNTLPNHSDFTRPTPKSVTPERQPLQGETTIPDLTGLTMRQVGDILAKQELHFNFSGSGLATSQYPSPGIVVNKGSTIEVKFSSLDDLNKEPLSGKK